MAQQQPQSGTGQYVLTLSCPDKQGIVHAVSSYLFLTGCNIVDSQQFGDATSGFYFMRVHFSAEAPVTLEKLRASFAATGDAFRMDWQIHPSAERARLLLLVSKFGHCLNDLLFRDSAEASLVDTAVLRVLRILHQVGPDAPSAAYLQHHGWPEAVRACRDAHIRLTLNDGEDPDAPPQTLEVLGILIRA